MWPKKKKKNKRGGEKITYYCQYLNSVIKFYLLFLNLSMPLIHARLFKESLSGSNMTVYVLSIIEER